MAKGITPPSAGNYNHAVIPRRSEQFVCPEDNSFREQKKGSLFYNVDKSSESRTETNGKGILKSSLFCSRWIVPD